MFFQSVDDSFRFLLVITLLQPLQLADQPLANFVDVSGGQRFVLLGCCRLVQQEQPYTFLLSSTETLQQSEAARFARWKASTLQ